jgi:hypothetical protein
MKPGFWDYIRAAFSARPAGMFVPPNWVGVGIFGFLGVLNPGFWLMGAGLELGYLYSLASNRRFRNLINGKFLSQERNRQLLKMGQRVRELAPEDQQRYEVLQSRCQKILAQQRNVDTPTGLQAQSEGLGRLLGIYLRLLLARQSISRVLRDSAVSERDRKSLEDRAAKLQEQVKNESLNAELRRSLASQLEILQQRLAKQAEARDKFAYVDAELTRIQEQVELLREQSALTTDPGTVGQKIDEISATLGGTSQWIQEQQRIYGRVDDLLDSPTVVMPPAAMEEEKQ